MRHGRAKSSRRTLQFYRLNAPHLVSPYKILLDGTFLVACVRNKIPLHERLSKTLQHEPHTRYVTRSTLTELETLSKRTTKRKSNDDPDENDFFAQARQYGLDECEIIESTDIPSNEKNTHSTKISKQSKAAFSEFSDASRDIFNLATDGGENRQAYFVATQDDSLANALREMPYVPLFRLGRAVLLLESPSSASRRYTTNNEKNKLASAGGLMTAEEKHIVKVVKEKEKRKRKERMEEEEKRMREKSAAEFGAGFGGGFNQRRKKRAKGPNPLSCKKRKVSK